MCRVYGRLYTWEGAIQACREVGWRLPTKEEWKSLILSYGNEFNAFKDLVKGGESGFDAILGGHYYPDGTFEDLEMIGSYWSSSESDINDNSAWKYGFRKEQQRVSTDLYRKEWALILSGSF